MFDNYPQYAQLVGLGIVWVSFHCSGMCGPIVAGLTAGTQSQGTRWEKLRGGAGTVLSYQGGRLVTYLILGATAGALGASVEAAVDGVARIAGLAIAGVFVLVGLYRLLSTEGSEPSFGGRFAGRLLGRALKWAGRRGSRRPSSMVIVGAAMGLLPCMTMYWVLSLSASTASPLHGAALMGLLVGLTTPVLLIAGCAPLVASPRWRKAGARLVPAGIVVSGIWLGLVTAAANEWIAHKAFELELGSQTYYVMLW